MIINAFNRERTHVGIRHKPEASVAKRIKRRPPVSQLGYSTKLVGDPMERLKAKGKREASGYSSFPLSASRPLGGLSVPPR